MSLPFTLTANDVFNPVAADGSPRGADIGETQAWGIEVETFLSTLQGLGGPVYETLAELNADLDYPAGKTGAVTADADPANNGFYSKAGTQGAGTWSYVSAFPGPGLVPLTNTGAGTADAIQAVTPYPYSSKSQTVLFLLNEVLADNTGAVTLSVNGNTATPMRNSLGEAFTGGELAAGMTPVISYDGSNYRVLISGDISSAIQQALVDAQAARDAAQTARDAAAASAATAGKELYLSRTLQSSLRFIDFQQEEASWGSDANTTYPVVEGKLGSKVRRHAGYSAGAGAGAEFIPVDPDENYVLAGNFEQITDGTGSRAVYLGLNCYDEDKVAIGTGVSYAAASNETISVADGAQTFLGLYTGEGAIVNGTNLNNGKFPVGTRYVKIQYYVNFTTGTGDVDVDWLLFGNVNDLEKTHFWFLGLSALVETDTAVNARFVQRVLDIGNLRSDGTCYLPGSTFDIGDVQIDGYSNLRLEGVKAKTKIVRSIDTGASAYDVNRPACIEFDTKSNFSITGIDGEFTNANSTVPATLSSSFSFIQLINCDNYSLCDLTVTGLFYMGVAETFCTNGQFQRVNCNGQQNRGQYVAGSGDTLNHIDCHSDGLATHAGTIKQSGQSDIVVSINDQVTQYAFNTLPNPGSIISNLRYEFCSARNHRFRGFSFSAGTENSGATDCTAYNIDEGHGFLFEEVTPSQAGVFPQRNFATNCTAQLCGRGAYLLGAFTTDLLAFNGYSCTTAAVSLENSQLCTVIGGSMIGSNPGSGVDARNSSRCRFGLFSAHSNALHGIYEHTGSSQNIVLGVNAYANTTSPNVNVTGVSSIEASNVET